MKYQDAETGIEIGITIPDVSSSKKKTCWVTMCPQGLDKRILNKIIRRYCKENRMTLILVREAEPYECHVWQHEAMTVFEVECSSKTSILIYEFGKL